MQEKRIRSEAREKDERGEQEWGLRDEIRREYGPNGRQRFIGMRGRGKGNL